MSKKTKKVRADVLMTERGLAPSREKAQRLILAGELLADDVPVQKPGEPVPGDVTLRLRSGDAAESRYVSRGGLKLEGALQSFGINVQGRVALDIGSSTGGFTDVLLQKGAPQVFAVDVGTNQLDWKLRSDPRVKLFEKTNARDLPFETIGRTVDLIVMDVSFISIVKILPALLQFATAETDWITLVKPQFEVGRELVGKGGIVRSEEARQAAVRAVTEAAQVLGLERLGLIESPITGTDGNFEYLAHWRLTSK